MQNPFQSPEHIQLATAFLAGFQHEWLQGGEVIQKMESEFRPFAADFSQAYAKWYERQTIGEHDAKRFVSCLAVGTAAAIQVAQAQQSQSS